jgi:hypothetical protein
MKGVMGVLLIGGGVFLMIALFNGTLKFPLGQLNLLGSTIGGQPTNVLGAALDAAYQAATGHAPTANLPGNTPITVVAPDKNTLKCPSGYMRVMASGGNAICVQCPGGKCN